MGTQLPPAGMQSGSGPVQGGQPQFHPTVPYGLPGAPPAIVLPPGVPFNQAPQYAQGGGGMGPQGPVAQEQPYSQSPGSYPPQFLPPAPQQRAPQGAPQPQGFPAAPQFQPAPPGFVPAQGFAVGFGQAQGQQQQPQPQPQPYPQQQQLPQGYAPQGPRVMLQDNMILDGPDVPPELRGRTYGQAKQIYSALAQAHLQSQGPRPPQQQQQPQGQPQGQQQPQGRPSAADFWRNPDEYLDRKLDDKLGPVIQGAVQQQVASARQQAASMIPDFAQLEGEIAQSMAGLDPRGLTDVNLWLAAADLARGRLARQGRLQPPQLQQGGVIRPPVGPGASVPAGAAPIPYSPPPQQVPPYAFFTEQPSAPWGAAAAAAGRVMTPEQRMYARKMGMSDQEYIDWSGGITPTQQWRQY